MVGMHQIAPRACHEYIPADVYNVSSFKALVYLIYNGMES